MVPIIDHFTGVTSLKKEKEKRKKKEREKEKTKQKKRKKLKLKRRLLNFYLRFEEGDENKTFFSFFEEEASVKLYREYKVFLVKW